MKTLMWLSWPRAGEDPEYAQKYLRSMASKAGVEVQLHLYESKQASVVTDVRGVHYRKLKAAILETLAPPSVGPACCNPHLMQGGLPACGSPAPCMSRLLHTDTRSVLLTSLCPIS